MKIVVVLFLFLFSAQAFAEDNMNQKTMEDIAISVAEEYRVGEGLVEFTFQGMPMYLVSDAKHDRMRIISPIVEYSSLAEAQKDKVLESNFHSSLDARYAVSKGILYSAYIHPISRLDEEQIKFAIYQVFNLRATFGDQYSSGALNYGKSEQQKLPEQKELSL